MTRRGAIVGAALLAAGQFVAKGQEKTQRYTGSEWWHSKPGKLAFTFGGEWGFSALEVQGPDGETITLTPEQIVAALRED